MDFYATKIFKKEFTHEVSKTAYLNACKWLAVNVYSNPSISQYIMVNIVKKPVKNNQDPVFEVTLYVFVDETKVSQDYCNNCKHLYNVFYSLDTPKCQECRLNGYKKSLEKNIQGIKTFCQEILSEK